MHQTSSILQSASLHHTITVVIPVFNGGAAFDACLRSLAGCLPSEIEVIVVVDGPDAASAQRAEDFGAKVIQLSRNFGPAHARNVGAAAAKGELLFFVDADVALHPETIAAIDGVFAAQVGEAAPWVALIGSYDDAPGAPNFLSQYKNLLHHYTHQCGRSEASTFWGACGVIRRDVFLAVGGFNVAYRYPCIEDIELGYRLRQYGYRIGLSKHVQVKHLKHWTGRSLLKAEVFYRAIPWTELLWRDRTWVNDLNLDRTNRLSVVAVYGLLASLGTLILWPMNSGVAMACAALLFRLNWPVYRFFYQKRGGWFTGQTVVWHWFYYAYSGFAFLWGTVAYWLNPDRVPPVVPTAAATTVVRSGYALESPASSL